MPFGRNSKYCRNSGEGEITFGWRVSYTNNLVCTTEDVPMHDSCLF